jgi:hypothetical protein
LHSFITFFFSSQFACKTVVSVDRKSTGSNFGCALRCEFFPHSFSQSSSDGTVTSAFVPQSGTAVGQVGVFRAGMAQALELCPNACCAWARVFCLSHAKPGECRNLVMKLQRARATANHVTVLRLLLFSPQKSQQMPRIVQGRMLRPLDFDGRQAAAVPDNEVHFRAIARALMIQLSLAEILQPLPQLDAHPLFHALDISPFYKVNFRFIAIKRMLERLCNQS